MAISDTQKVDLLYKKIAWAATKTDTNPPKEAYNEANPSPLLIRGDTIWQLSGSIPASIPSSTSSVVQVYKDGGGAGYTATVECTELAVTDNRTWSTGLTNWIDPQFGATYFAKVYVDTAASTTPQTTGTALQAAGVNDDQWYFDYQSGILNFIGTNLPASIATDVTGKSVFISGARYVGPTGATNFSNGLTIGNITIGGNTITGNSAGITFGSNIFIGNLFYSSNGQPFTSSTYGNIQVLANLSSGTISSNISTTGNIATTSNMYATYFIGSAAYLTDLPATYSNSNVASYLTSYTGNITAGNIILQNKLYTNTIAANTGTVVVVQGNGALGLPTGTTSQRPTGSTGYVRYNTELASPEYFDGTVWVPVVNGITDQQITPNDNGYGTGPTFTLSQVATAIGVMVSINGVLQRPNTGTGGAYTVSGDQITFTETPQTTDIIDIRFLASAVTYEFDNINPGTYLNRITATTAPTLIDTVPVTGNTAVNWQLTAVDNINTKYKSSTVSSINDGSVVYYNEYGVLKSDIAAGVATFTSNITSGNINLWAIGDSGNVAVTFERLALGSATQTGYLTAGPSGDATPNNYLVSGVKTFVLDTNGNLTLPSGGAINYANGASILTGITAGGTTYSNTNVAAYLTTDATVTALQANLGVTQLWANANVASINANIGGFYTWANTNFGTSSYSNTNANALLSSNTISTINTTGNVSVGGNLTVTRAVTVSGDVTATGNITGTNLTSKTTGSWTVTTGTNTYSITVPASGTYQIWVRGNIPNGIITYLATVVVTNTNVPVVGAQYAWVYNGGGTPIDFTSIPNQFTGTGNAIVRSSTSPSATTNIFDFGINNTSGSSQTVYWGYVTLG